jgi:hypothetical protein
MRHRGQITPAPIGILWKARLGGHTSERSKSVTLSWTCDNRCDTPPICYSGPLQASLDIDISAVTVHRYGSSDTVASLLRASECHNLCDTSALPVHAVIFLSLPCERRHSLYREKRRLIRAWYYSCLRLLCKHDISRGAHRCSRQVGARSSGAATHTTSLLFSA